MRRHTDEPTAVEWLPNELRQIAESDDLDISPFREDGATYGTPTCAVEGALSSEASTVSSRLGIRPLSRKEPAAFVRPV